ncbi:MAG: hypothetical protein IJ054_06595 [Lachnospiraceae bacterium]|nr:hypothetical protein [Lachnospiraceae bacterium]MBQ9232850.1 hypothetical protein [Lachnospiraceae bacterium]
MKNGWKKLFIISLIIILLEIIGAVIVMLPFYARNMVFVNIEKGDSVKTKGYFDMLDESGQEKVISYLDDFAATLCQSYIDGKKDYEETVASLDAIREIEKTNQIAEGYILDVASNEFKKTMLDICDANVARDSSTSFSLGTRLDLIKQRLDNQTRERLMIELINDKYKGFLDENVSGEALIAMCSLVADNAYYEAYDYAGVISSNADCVVKYRKLYVQLEDDYNNSKYFDVLDNCDGIEVDAWDIKYKQLFEDLYTAAYNDGKQYYINRLNEYVSAGDKISAVALMNQIEEYYGDEIDVSSVNSTLFESWQRTYLEFMETFDPMMEAHTVNTVLLYDINDDDIPEMFLFDISDIEMSYIGCEVYNVVNNRCNHLGYYNVINICDDGYLITLPSSGGGDEAYALTYYDGESLSEGEDCKKIDETYYVNGEEVSDSDYLSVRTGILAHASAYTIHNSKNSSIEDAMDYIMLFENK